MARLGAPILLLLCCPALSLPLSSQVSEEDEKVTRCISEVLAQTLARPSTPAGPECGRILRADQRVLALLHHEHLLRELEELVREEGTKKHPSEARKRGHPGEHYEEEETKELREEVKEAVVSQTTEEQGDKKRSPPESRVAWRRWGAPGSEERGRPHGAPGWAAEENSDEEEGKRSGPGKRVAEQASDEDTAQFEAEEKGVKILGSQSHGHGGHGQEEEEEEEEEGRESRELAKLEDIELQLKKAAEKLRELRRG